MNAEDAPCTLSRSIGAASASRGGIAPPSSLDPDRGGSGLEPADDGGLCEARVGLGINWHRNNLSSQAISPPTTLLFCHRMPAI